MPCMTPSPVHVLLAVAFAFAASACGPQGDPAVGEPASTATDAAPDANVGPLDIPPPVAPPVPPPVPPPAASPAQVPGPYQGTFASSQEACATPGDTSQLTIGAETITFYESTGPITAVAVADAGVTLTTRLAGEGQVWDATYRFGLSDDGNTLTDLDGGMTRVRCIPVEAPAG